MQKLLKFITWRYIYIYIYIYIYREREREREREPKEGLDRSSEREFQTVPPKEFQTVSPEETFRLFHRKSFRPFHRKRISDRSTAREFQTVPPEESFRPFHRKQIIAVLLHALCGTRRMYGRGGKCIYTFYGELGSERKRQSGRPRRRCVDNIYMCHRHLCWGVLDWVHTI